MKPTCATFSDSLHAVQTTKLVFLLKALLKTGPPSLGILYRLYIYRLQRNLHVRPSRTRDMLFKLLQLGFLLKALLNQNWTTKSLLFRRILLKASTIPTY